MSRLCKYDDVFLTYTALELSVSHFILCDATLARYVPLSYSYVCLLQVGVLLKQLNVGSWKQRYTIAQELYFSDAEDLGKTQMGSLPTEAPTAGGLG